ncbi:hypothetical protein A9Q83_00620 [Alphaproteobacteria bacterium 46_93_T64]|mgnify:CR=1 FL=1|nr:hypothetical protein A9Q83_00620 [Alphaproteobacteria bacterium 46_93_T64]
MSIYLPTRSVVRELWKRQLEPSKIVSENFDDAKMGIALAWPRMMVTTGSSSDVFDVTASLVMGVLSEKPASSGNTALAFVLLVLTLRRNNWMLDIANEDAVQFMSRLVQGNIEEKNIVIYLRKRSISVE